MSKKQTGRCMCGSVTVEFDLEKEVFDACHCGMCRKWGGGPALTVDGGTDVRFKGEENISVYDSSEWAQRGFCKKCGTHLFYRLKETGFRNLPLGLLDGNENFKFHLEIFIDKKPEGYSFSEPTTKMTEEQVFAKYLSN
ncbi:MAG: GFA family protein [Bdellovibrionota bacterium]